MRDLVIHVKSGLKLDFAKEDFGGSEQAAIIRAWQQVHRAERGDFICYRHRDHELPEMYLQQRGELLVAAHWRGTGLAGSHEIVHGVSDEHKRQVEYVHRAGASAGFEVRTEVRLPTKVISDAVIFGPQVHMGVEVQRSALTVTAARARTTKARRAGVQTVWFSDNRSDPKWLLAVPGVRMMDMPWDTLPRQRSVTVVSGVRVIVPRRCQDLRNGQCSQRRYGCDEWHPDHEPRLETLVDDLAELVPAGELVPMLYVTLGGREYVFVVSRDDKALYERMLGKSADVPLGRRERTESQLATRIECAADASIAIEQPSRACPYHSYWPNGAWRCWVPGCPGSDMTQRAAWMGE